MTTTVKLDQSHRLVLPRDLRKAAGFDSGQKLLASATPGRITLEAKASTKGKIVRRGKFKVWTGPVPPIPIAEALEQARHYQR